MLQHFMICHSWWPMHVCTTYVALQWAVDLGTHQSNYVGPAMNRTSSPMGPILQRKSSTHQRSSLWAVLHIRTQCNHCPLILYGGKLWRWETLVNLANDHELVKFISAKFYKVSHDIIHLRYYIGNVNVDFKVLQPYTSDCTIPRIAWAYQ